MQFFKDIKICENSNKNTNHIVEFNFLGNKDLLLIYSDAKLILIRNILDGLFHDRDAIQDLCIKLKKHFYFSIYLINYISLIINSCTVDLFPPA